MKNNKYTYVNKEWGYELWIVNNSLYCAKILHSNGEWSSGGRYHYHKKKTETFYILDGECLLDIKDKKECILLKKGESYTINKGTKHKFKALFGECDILEISTHHEDSDSYYIENE